ncbi:hypothetical protein [Kribbella sandramycini]|uniref:hypothetical protein n=1 Tax=Kribbella sandramycini TaxID=60450 RepID=UPI00307D9192
MKAELRSLPRSLADLVAQHLVASGRFLDDDPERAYLHARTARRLAARLGGVREAVAITAYLAEHYDEALTEFRAVRRMTGNHEVIAMMADCERALGRPVKALALAQDKHVRDLSEATQMELLIVTAGARRDMGQTAAAVQMLEVPELSKRTRAEWLPRLRYAYADALEAAGRTDDAVIWFHRAAGSDADGSTGAAERAAALEGLEFTDLDADEDDYLETEDAETGQDDADEDDDLEEAEDFDDSDETDDLDQDESDDAEDDLDDDSEDDDDSDADLDDTAEGDADEDDNLDDEDGVDGGELAGEGDLGAAGADVDGDEPEELASGEAAGETDSGQSKE